MTEKELHAAVRATMDQYHKEAPEINYLVHAWTDGLYLDVITTRLPLEGRLWECEYIPVTKRFAEAFKLLFPAGNAPTNLIKVDLLFKDFP